MSALVAALLASLDGGSLVEQLKPSVVQIVDVSPGGKVRSSGSGFLVSSDGLLVTNHHVIEHMQAPQVRFFDKREVKIAGLLIDDEDQDLAVLKLEGNDFVPLKIDPQIPEAGSYVALLAAPLGLTWTFAEGVVSTYRPDGLPAELQGACYIPGPRRSPV